MASASGQPRRHRSSTGASRGLDPNEENTEAAELIKKLSSVTSSPTVGDDAYREAQSAANALRQALEQDDFSKDIFRHGNGFEAAISLVQSVLQTYLGSVSCKGELLKSVITMLASACWNHRGNTQYFSHYRNGWQAIQEALLSVSVTGPDEPKALIASVLSGLFEASTWPEQAFAQFDSHDGGTATHSEGEVLVEGATIQFPEPLAIAVRLCAQSLAVDDTAFAHALTTIAALLSRGECNKVRLWQTGLLSDLIKMRLAAGLPSQAAPIDKLISILNDLGLPSLEDTANLFEEAVQSDWARKLLLETLQKSKRPHAIHFDLSLHGYSSIEIPTLPRHFPPSTGYALNLWLQIDTFDPACHTTLFGAFDSSQTCFVLMYLEKDSHQIILQTSIRSNKPSIRFKSLRMAAGKWYHVALVHRRNAGDPRQSPVALFVDGEFSEHLKCAYPESPPEHDGNQHEPTGSQQSPAARRIKPVQAFFGTPHALGLRFGRNEVSSRWSLANAKFYQSPLSDEFIAVQYHLGPRYTGNYQDCLGPLFTYRASAELNRYNDLLHPDRAEKSDIVTATEQRGQDVIPETRLLLSINPGATITFDGVNAVQKSLKKELDRKAYSRYQLLVQKSSAVAINAAIPSFNEAIGRSYGTGIMTGDPVVVTPRSLDDASWCLAGSIPVLVRLLEASSTKTALLQSVQIFFDCVKDNWRISETMEKRNGFGLLAILLREKLGLDAGPSVVSRRTTSTLAIEDGRSIALTLLHRVLAFVGYDKDRPENSMIVNPMGYRVLLVDFDTWRRCDLETQSLYFAQFGQFVSHNKHQSFNQKRLVRMRVARRIIDALKSEEFCPEIVPIVMTSLKGLLDQNGATPMYKELAMFVTWALQDEHAMAVKPSRSMVSIVGLRRRSSAWAKSGRSNTMSSGTCASRSVVSKSELGMHVLQLLHDVLCDDMSNAAMKRFNRVVPTRWLLHLLAESNPRIINLTSRILCRALAVLGTEFKDSFAEKNGGFITLRSRLKGFWRSWPVWTACFAILFGSNPPSSFDHAPTLFELVRILSVDDSIKIVHPEVLPTITGMLEAGLRQSVAYEDETDVKILQTVIQLLKELYGRCSAFRDFATSSGYVQELLFVLYPVLVGSDRLSAEVELQAEKGSLSFKGEAVAIRSHSNSLEQRPPSVRSLNVGDDGSASQRIPSPRPSLRVEAPRKLSSFVLVNPKPGTTRTSPAQFNAVMSPNTDEPVKMNVGNSIVESLLEVAVSLFIDVICNRDRFSGIGLFLKVPPGFREHQAYFESYVLIHTLTHLWSHLQLNQGLLIDTRVLTNLSRYCQHMSEAVFEGWFIDGAQPLLDFSGKALEYLQQESIAAVKGVRLCSQHINAIRIVFLRVCLWRLAELDEESNEKEATMFLNKMNYWQTILFSSENQETPFVRLICYLLYMKLVSEVREVRLAAARLWRTVLVQKPTETATLLTFAMGSEQRHLSTGFMKLVSMDDDEFVVWVDENRPNLDTILIDALNRPWDEFVNEENRRTEESARNRLQKRQEKLRQWQAEETSIDDAVHRYEVSTNHWRANVHAQEKLKVQRSIQDHHENVHHLCTVFAGLEKQNKRPGGISPAVEDTKWQLDETEALNRMRMRTIADSDEKSQPFQPKKRTSKMITIENGNFADQVEGPVSIMSSAPGSPSVGMVSAASKPSPADRSRSASMSNSQLLEGGFEMVDDPREADGLVEDKNRKVMTSLLRGDVVQQLCNISRIVGLEACEGLLVVGRKCLYLQDNFFQRSDGEIVSVSQAPTDERDPYVQLISGKDVGSQRTKHSVGDQETRHWTWAEVLSISKRRFLLRDVSVEVFFTDGRSYLLTCMSIEVRDTLYNAIVSRAPHVHGLSGVSPEDAWRLDTLQNPEEGPQSFGSKVASVFNPMQSHAATKKWVRGEMSNFQYLMLVNTLAGRTFNDLTQYPVFPWVLADYHHEELDLEDPKSFRDLSKPMGCQTVSREIEYKDRYKQFADMGDHTAAFHYGTHYSSAMIVSSYLIRLQPFVQSYLLLQGGSFDHADRLFDSIERAWISCSRDNMSDVRELTPEFFYLPEFLLNANGYDFGSKQANGELVDNVKLPAWAKGDPHVFVMKHREALESPHVSAHLHHWIDLVFGHKQRGEAAVEATNVFQHLSYQGAKDLDAIRDPVERLASIGIIHSFGQTPHQVFHKPHPARELDRTPAETMDTLVETLVRLPRPLVDSEEKIADVIFSATQERLLCSAPNTLHMPPKYDRYVQWGYADHSLRFFSAHTKRLLGLYEATHVHPITTATFPDTRTLVTASADGSLALWTVQHARDRVVLAPRTHLFGHRAAVTALAASRVFSTLVSASTDGHVLIWALNRQQCIRTLHAPPQPPIHTARISNTSGRILLCRGPHALIYTLNGHLLVRQTLATDPSDALTAASWYEPASTAWRARELLFVGHASGAVSAWTLAPRPDGAWCLRLLKRLPEPARGGSAATAVTAVLPMAQAVFVADEEGRVWEWDCVARLEGGGRRGGCI